MSFQSDADRTPPVTPGRLVTILHLEDSPLDAELANTRLKKSGLAYKLDYVVTRDQFLDALSRRSYDLILSDFNIPGFDGSEALTLAAERQPNTPFIFVSGVLGEEVAIDTLKRGATDYVLKTRMDRLVPAVERALAEADGRRARHQAERGLRHSEERYRALVSILTDVPWRANAAGEVDSPHPAWTAFTGQTWDEYHGAGWLDAVHPADRERLTEAWRQALARPGKFVIEIRLWHAPSQTFRQIENRATPVLDSDGNLREWVGTCNDIHDLRTAERERERLLEAERAARNEAEQANRLKDEFLATVSHELRTPLNAILGWAELITRGGGNEEDNAEGLQAILRNARAQSQIIEDLLDMSRITSGKVRLDVQEVNLATLLDETIHSVMPSAEMRRLSVTQAVQPSVSPVKGDPSRLRQVVWNLLSNSIKFTPAGGQVRARLTQIDGSVTLTIEDTGEGIAADLLPYVFDRFRQEDGSTTRRHGGLGLGLSIVKHLVELHGGTVAASSDGKGKGSRFVVSLPALFERSVAQPPLPRQLDAPGRASSLSGVKVLVVDDEADARRIVSRILQGCGATVVSAASAAEAMRLLRLEKPDILLSDIGMPEADGYELIRSVRQLSTDDRNIPAVALTAFARSDDRTKALQAGFQRHIPKPLESADLLRTVSELTGRS